MSVLPPVEKQDSNQNRPEQTRATIFLNRKAEAEEQIWHQLLPRLKHLQQPARFEDVAKHECMPLLASMLLEDLVQFDWTSRRYCKNPVCHLENEGRFACD